ncbi:MULTISPECIES: sensor histidine kinase [unclassified Streptomyces]|uniref:sensor histidine kinase n=1 Tax=unclassified Streptomyces TaxID=2593676 RepID=UPI0001C19819|nr:MULTISPECIES: sensor histidine kinase [unclassified Streptomyces]AEN09704.1 integral membrane sensor signal transduction histidine kinase [Streptomyces sp. SirexAA-E]MYR66330.1 sensor histidine kinase [Streptomyces sp. SID4939]MYS02796.1 sensor histidine kinase [Streptomyces sp. SID4940]MYT64438.1 sensor histidine kinase [Streptomyces sp. SID8357]MYT87251.1 sensor histidine kinase [Streptomyces sp. SID8360]
MSRTTRPSGRGQGRPRLGRGFRRPGSPGPYTLMPWLLLGLGAFSNLWQGETSNPWVGGLGLFAFNTLYVSVVFRGFDRRKRESTTSYVLLVAMGVVTFSLAIGYGGSWLLFFPLLSLAYGTILRGRGLGWGLIILAVCASLVALWRGGHSSEPWTIGYGTFISGAVTAAILTLSETVAELRATRQELARSAVEQERLRFSRDLHDLLGHTLSVIVVKSEAARRLAPRDLDAALAQVGDIESVGRQALTEIREAVTGYREGSLDTELNRARSALTAAGIEPVIRRSGPPLTPQTEVLLGWVAREAVTNAVRHSGASRCEFAVRSTRDQVRLTVTDDGTGPVDPDGSVGGGTGLKGLTERLAAAGGSLESGPGPKGGFVVVAELPYEAEYGDQGAAADPECGC